MKPFMVMIIINGLKYNYQKGDYQRDKLSVKFERP